MPLTNGKYPRTYHYDFSLGSTSDDKINHNWWENVCKIEQIVHTEKLDGESTMIGPSGVFARSHAAPTKHPWANYLKERWSFIKDDLESMGLEIFGENLYAIHSIEYPNIEEHFYVFAVRQKGVWLSWFEVCEWAEYFNFKTVPLIGRSYPTTFEDSNVGKDDYTDLIIKMVSDSSMFGSIDVENNELCVMEGVVSRNADSFSVETFKENVFKYVRPSHVKTDQHWTRNWKRARLKHEH